MIELNTDHFIQRIRDLTKPLYPVNAGHETRLKPIRDIRCVAFDFYGTMFISAVGDIGVDEEQQQKNAAGFTEALEDTGFEITNSSAGERGITLFEQTVKSYIESARREGVDYPEPNIISVWTDVLNGLASSGDIRGEVRKEEAIRFGIEFEFRVNDIWPVPGLKKILKGLIELDIELGIISNSQYYIPIAFEALLGSSPSDFGFNDKLLIWSYRAKCKKPSLDLYRLFIEAAGKETLQPRQILYVGNDIRKDIQPAKEAGMHTALYVGDQRSIRHQPEDLKEREYQPDLIISDLSQIADCLTN